MPVDIKGYRVFIASPSGLEEERQAFRDTIMEYNEAEAIPRRVMFEAVGWQYTLPGMGRPQSLINEEVKECDYFILVLWDRWGSPPGESGKGEYTSGTEEEYNVALECFKDDNSPMRQIVVLFKAVDEGDKCPVPLARFVKCMATDVEHKGIKNVRFMIAGISPFFDEMVKEAPGVARIFYKKMKVLPLQEPEATELLKSKFTKVTKEAEAQKQQIEIEEGLIERVIQLSGRHPHILQLLGSHLVENENEDPDGIISKRDLIGAIRAICYEDRDWVYEPLLHTLELEGKMEPFKSLLYSAEGELPTRINKTKAMEIVDIETLKWFVAHDILFRAPGNEYHLNDEFLRVRVIMDEEQQAAEDIEARLIERGSFEDEEKDWPESWQDDEDPEL